MIRTRGAPTRKQINSHLGEQRHGIRYRIVSTPCTYRPLYPDVRVHHPYNTPFGLTEQVVYFYGGWREADGTLHAFERKFIGPMTAGLWLMNARGGSVRIEPDSAKTVRGEVKRQYAGRPGLASRGDDGEGRRLGWRAPVRGDTRQVRMARRRPALARRLAGRSRCADLCA